jgi:hypothetical protein
VVSKKVTWGPLAAWVVHDLEELATMSSWTRRMHRKHPVIPETTPAQAANAIGTVGLVIAAAAADGARTGGRSGFFQSTLIGFGPHSTTHAAASAALRGYTPGVLTAPTLVAPFPLWAWRQLRRHNVPTSGNVAKSAAWFPIVVIAAHLTARLCARTRPVTTPIRTEYFR